MTESTGTNDPTNAGVTNDGDVNTAILDKLAGRPNTAQGPSEGEPGSTQTPPPAEDTGEPQDVKPREGQPDDGKVTRLEQRVAQTSKLLASLGIDPDSDLAERYERGLVSKEELLLKAGIVPQQTIQTDQKPASAIDKLAQFKTKINQKVSENKGILESDILEFIDVASELANENIQLQNESSLERQFTECRDATLSVINQDSKHAESPANIKEIESQIFLASTDNLVAVEGKGDPRSLTARNYGFYADKNLGRLNQLRDYWFNQGMQAAKKTPPKPPEVNPISPNTGSSPITPPESPTTLDNMEERARKYVESFGEQV